MSTQRDFNATFRKIVIRSLTIAGIGTYSSLSIMGGCIPADCGEYDDLEQTPYRVEQHDADQARDLTVFENDNPTATAREKLHFLYGTSAQLTGPSSNFGLTQIALELLVQDAAENNQAIDLHLCDQLCNSLAGVESCRVGPAQIDGAENSKSLFCSGVDASGCIAGRNPAGLLSNGVVECEDPRGQYWAYLAHMEASAVIAFGDLYRELAHYGAPRELLVAVARAVCDEVIHTQLTTALANRFGAVPETPTTAADRPIRSLYEIALDNAAEGCVREAFAALETHYLSQVSEDTEERAAYAKIALDETFHAELSWEIDEWITQHLTHEQRLRVAGVKLEAVKELEAEIQNRDDAFIGDVVLDAKIAAPLLREMANAMNLDDALPSTSV